MTWFRKLFERYDPEQDEAVQALNAAAAKHREKAEEARRRRNLLVDVLLRARTDEGGRHGAHR